MASTKNFSQGYREIDYRFELLNSDNSVIGDITNLVESAEVTNNSFSSIQRTAKFNIVEQAVNPSTITQLVSKSFWQGDVLPSQWTGDVQSWRDQLAYPRGERQGSGVNPIFEVKQIGTSEPPVYDYKNDAYGDFYNYWENRSSGNPGTDRLDRASQGIMGNTQVFNKVSTSAANYLALSQQYRITLTGSTQIVYFCGFYNTSTPAIQPKPSIGYIGFTAGNTVTGITWVPDADITLTDVSKPTSNTGWQYFSGHVTLPASGVQAKVSMVIGCQGSASGTRHCEYDQFWWSTKRTSNYTFGVEGLSPILDASISNVVNAASLMRMSQSYSDWNGSSNRSLDRVIDEINVLEIRKRSNGGAWSSYVNLIPLSNLFSENEDMRGKEVQLRWRSSSYDRDPNELYSFKALWNWKLKVTALTDINNPAYTGINYNRHRIKPYLRVNESDTWKEYPLGIFLLNTPTRKYNGSSAVRDIEAYDQIVVMQESKAIYPVVLTPHSTGGWIQTLKNLVTNTNTSDPNYMGFSLPSGMVNFTSSTVGVGGNSKTWEMGTPWLRIFNDVLQSINYESIWFDSTGKATARPYQTPTDAPVKFTYSADETSIIFVDTEESVDTFNTANVFVVANQMDEWGNQLVGRYVNDNYGSPSSTVEQGRYIVRYEEIDIIDTRPEMDAYVKRLAFESSQVYSQIKISSALDPSHENFDKVRINYLDSGIVGDFTETAWTMHLDDKPYMEHRLRRIVNI